MFRVRGLSPAFRVIPGFDKRTYQNIYEFILLWYAVLARQSALKRVGRMVRLNVTKRIGRIVHLGLEREHFGR